MKLFKLLKNFHFYGIYILRYNEDIKESKEQEDDER